MKIPITREQFELVRPLLDSARRRTRPRQHDLFDILNAILIREEHKLTWRQLPDGSPPWRTVHQYHTEWSMTPKAGGAPLLEQIKQILASTNQ